MRLPNLLASRWGRLTAFFLLYLTEGIPYGFTSIALVTQMRRQGVPPKVIGMYFASLSLPWAWKWMIGPVVDVFYSDRLGRRRMWIVMAQGMMVLTLMAAMPVDFSTQILLFTCLILVHNVFAATQDVAIDALACSTLKAEERGLANGLMFAGAYTGQILGGAGVLLLSGHMQFNTTFLFVAASILVVTGLVSVHLREPRGGSPQTDPGRPTATAPWREVRGYIGDALRAIFGSRGALSAAVFALLPHGAYALSLPLQSSLAVELGQNNREVAELMLFSGILSAYGCVVGGLLSDRLGRRRMLALYVLATVLPTLYLAWAMRAYHWIMPIDPTLANRPAPHTELVLIFWLAALVYAVFQGLMYGTRTALFMDVTTPAVAATQFTAYMALLNVVIAYSAWWQGHAVEAWGYPLTLTVDAAAGLLCILLLPWIVRGQKGVRTLS